MENTFYSIQELTEILRLHPKTILRFIHEGKIKAHKIGRSWRISQEALKHYAHAELATPTQKAEPVDFGSISNRMKVSAVIEIVEQNSEEASRLSNSLMAALNCTNRSDSGSRFDFFYYPETQKAKYVLYGTPVFIAEIMTMFSRLAEIERNEP